MGIGTVQLARPVRSGRNLKELLPKDEVFVRIYTDQSLQALVFQPAVRGRKSDRQIEYDGTARYLHLLGASRYGQSYESGNKKFSNLRHGGMPSTYSHDRVIRDTPRVRPETSSVTTLKPASVQAPNEVTIATSVASRPR